ncbi:MaoC/PaaZ C-terminal domain-containing protein [Propioniciclava flava]|jgi:acyl dehydratase|uniref:Dehydratase n=1 Tax=Propioniciclava flava TaxID=2072026 RepID=A0A4V1Q7M9_9ACTN|nr:MaoC/PaaZ C-terminal domain-containing protein [Propioniciclava flava]RXW33148.1 dehydratase [Propioniciclava flava]
MSAHVVEVGTELPPLVLHYTREDLVRYAGASGDFNPIHWSDRAARALGMPSVIAHGMLTMGKALRIVTDWVGDPARVEGYFVRFTKPVPVPDDDAGVDVHVTARVTALEDGLATIAIDALLGETRVLGSAQAQVRCG